MTDTLQQLCNRFRTKFRRALLALGLSRVAGITLVAMVVLILTDFVWHFSFVERFGQRFARVPQPHRMFLDRIDRGGFRRRRLSLAENPSDPTTWDERVEPVRNNPDPEKLDEFI